VDRHPQASIGLATGHLFDVLDVDGPEGHEAIRELAASHSLYSAGPLVRTSGSPGAILRPRWPRSRHRCEPGWKADRQCGQLARSSFRPAPTAWATAAHERPGRGTGPGGTTAPVGQCNRQLWESTRNLYNLVAAGPSTTARSTEGCWRPPNGTGCLMRRRARPAAPGPRAARSALPTPPSTPERTVEFRC
jgi:hypothetical protein